MKNNKVPVNIQNHFLSVGKPQDHCCDVIGVKKWPTMHNKLTRGPHTHCKVLTAILWEYYSDSSNPKPVFWTWTILFQMNVCVWNHDNNNNKHHYCFVKQWSDVLLILLSKMMLRSSVNIWTMTWMWLPSVTSHFPGGLPGCSSVNNKGRGGLQWNPNSAAEEVVMNQRETVTLSLTFSNEAAPGCWSCHERRYIN